MKGARLQFLLVMVFLAAFSAQADIYQKKGWSCDFEYNQQRLESDPDNLDYQAWYAICLVLKGEESRGLSRLYRFSENDEHILSSFFLAQYFSKNKLGEGPVDLFEDTDIDRMLSLYNRVLHLIDQDPAGYKQRNNYQDNPATGMEMGSYSRIPMLHFRKYAIGLISDHNRHVKISPSCSKNFSELDARIGGGYEAYTQDSLSQMLESSATCLSVPQKDYFDEDEYAGLHEKCQSLKASAEELIVLDQKRTKALQDSSCKQDIFLCEDYLNTLEAILETVLSEIAPDWRQDREGGRGLLDRYWLDWIDTRPT